MSRILAIDYGLKRCGIAVTDPLRIIASGLTTVPTAELMDYLKSYCAQEPVASFVVGYPLHADGTPAQIAPQVDVFIGQLEKQFPDKPVDRQDERYTSYEASRIIVQSVKSKTKRRDKGLVDKIAAALILENFMQTHHWL